MTSRYSSSAVPNKFMHVTTRIGYNQVDSKSSGDVSSSGYEKGWRFASPASSIATRQEWNQVSVAT